MPEPEDRRPSDPLGWLIFVLLTALCALAAYIQCSGVRQLPP